jgi:hypothetical protein
MFTAKVKDQDAHLLASQLESPWTALLWINEIKNK